MYSRGSGRRCTGFFVGNAPVANNLRLSYSLESGRAVKFGLDAQIEALHCSSSIVRGYGGIRMWFSSGSIHTLHHTRAAEPCTLCIARQLQQLLRHLEISRGLELLRG